MKTKNPVILVIRDGWGYRRSRNGNIIASAKTPWDDYFTKNYPTTLIECAGKAVGLPEGFQGNSEVGHLTIGSGRIIFQSMQRIDESIATGDFFNIKEFKEIIKSCKKHKSHLHLAGLLQTQGVHSHINHLFALLDLCDRENFKDVYIHVFTDGRDAPVNESLKHLKSLERKLKKIKFGKIVTVSGRYYAMDRNKNYSRTKKAYDNIVGAKKERFKRAIDYVASSHAKGISDEFIKPGSVIEYNGLNDNDGFIFFNFRTDRTRQLTEALIEKKFEYFNRKKTPFISFVAMTNYYSPFPAKVAFDEIRLNNLLGEVVSSAGMKQLRISETEKYAHVTFFFNGQLEKKLRGEDRILIPSPSVSTYDLKPEMSVYKIAEKLVGEIEKKKYDLIVVNLVNCDMVGHTGDYVALKKAVEAVDIAVGEIVNSGLENGYTSLVFADHGNAEDKSSKFATSHTTNPVPLTIISNKTKNIKLNSFKGGLSDIAPSTLKIIGIKKPKEMTGRSLV